jgi:hypothetical protein
LTFAQPGSNLKLDMLGEPVTTVVTGQGLGPDLRVPVPFAMARRAGKETTYAALYEPYTNTSALLHFEQSSAGHFIVRMASFTDELTVEPGTFVLVRKHGSALVRLAICGAKRKDLLESSGNFPVEVDWPADGKSVDVYAKTAQSGWLRVFAPRAETVRLNGKEISGRNEGNFRRVEW